MDFCNCKRHLNTRPINHRSIYLPIILSSRLHTTIITDTSFMLVKLSIWVSPLFEAPDTHYSFGVSRISLCVIITQCCPFLCASILFSMALIKSRKSSSYKACLYVNTLFEATAGIDTVEKQLIVPS